MASEELEQIIENSRSVATIDLDAIAHNLSVIRRSLNSDDVLICGVVKANAYGHGACEVAETLVANGVDRLAVVTVNEAQQLRDHGIEKPILLLGPLTQSELAIAAKLDLEFVIWDAGFLTMLEQTDVGSVKLHLKVDSGMGRLGVTPLDDVDNLARAIKSSPHELVGIMTHFSSADELDGEVTDQQAILFQSIADSLKGHFPKAILHAANSAATLRKPGTQLDMVRVGVALYGLDPCGNDPKDFDLRPALEWHAKVGAVKTIAAGGSVGYGRKFMSKGQTRAAIVCTGYADGMRRQLGTQGFSVAINGQLHEMIGTVSMDSFGVDVSSAAVGVSAGDIVTLIGGYGDGHLLSAERMAAALETINYEVTCLISSRVPRVFHHSGVPV